MRVLVRFSCKTKLMTLRVSWTRVAKFGRAGPAQGSVAATAKAETKWQEYDWRRVIVGCDWAMLFNLTGVNPALVVVSHRPGIESCRHASNNVLDA